jgi:hypothetical protein
MKIWSITTAAVAAMAGLALTAAQPASAQTRDQALKEIFKISIVVEDVAGNATACGVRQGDLRDAFANRLKGAPLSIVDQATAKDDPEVVTLYIKGSVMPLDIPGVPAGPCITHLNVKLYDYQKVVLAASRRETFGSVELWEKGAMIATDRAGHGKAVYDSVTEKASDLVLAWKLDNPGK